MQKFSLEFLDTIASNNSKVVFSSAISENKNKKWATTTAIEIKKNIGVNNFLCSMLLFACFQICMFCFSVFFFVRAYSFYQQRRGHLKRKKN